MNLGHSVIMVRNNIEGRCDTSADINPALKEEPMAKTRVDRGVFNAGNNQYHGVESVKEFGALAHANKFARILLREGKVASEEEALSLANFEVQRLRWTIEGFQGNRLARNELRREAELKQLDMPRLRPSRV